MKDSERYSYFQVPEGARREALDHVPRGSSVLDVGCWSGSNGRYLVQQTCRVFGIEPDAEAASLAEEYEHVWVGKVEDRSLLEKVASKGPFEAILFMDVLEHLESPASVLREILPMLSPSGVLITSIPNVAYWGVRYQLLRGRWRYEDFGILDRTHLRFFTNRSAVELLEYSGLDISWSGISFEKIPLVKRWPWLEFRIAHRFPELFAVQFLFVARKATR